jgi:phosphate starvation-inducible PhoH-like protein
MKEDYLDIQNLLSQEEVKIPLGEDFNRIDLFGNLDQNINLLKEDYEVDVIPRDNEILIKGKDANIVKGILEDFVSLINDGEILDGQKISYIISLNRQGLSYKEGMQKRDVLCFTHMGKPIKPKTIGQKAYAKAIRESDIVFGIGPAGTGKTYLAVALAINAYKNKAVQKIILARPAVEAGERLGFLPGDLQEKVDPYLRPLYDALYDMIGKESALRLKEKEIIEVVPLAYMRGRTLDNAFIILDEAQNSTKEQMKMFLTRMGFGSKMVITGDITQIDLPRGKQSGLVEAYNVLKSLADIKFCYLTDVDVVRHELVRKIVNAYGEYEEAHGHQWEED